MKEEKKKTESSGQDAGSDRLISVDVLRGFDMFWIVGAAELAKALDKLSGRQGTLDFIASQLRHKDWEGFAFYDMIFPLFVFLAGVSLVFSLTKHLQQEGAWAAHKRLIRRFVLLMALGIFYYGGFANAWPGIRLMGVLQRIAISYFVASLLFCHLKLRGLIITCLLLLIGYWAFLSFVPVPGVGKPSFDKEKNWGVTIDNELLPGRRLDGRQSDIHKIQFFGHEIVYAQGTWDPEGLLSSIPAVATCLLGVFAGMVLIAPSISKNQKWLCLIGAGILCVIAGYLWGHQFPIIKKLWTSSYVLVAGGYSAILLGSFYLLIDVLPLRFWIAPFLWVGSNALTIYLANNILDFDDLAKRFVGGDIKSALGNYDELALAIVSFGLVLALARFLHRRKIFIRV